MEAIFKATCDAQEIPGVVLLASNATGDFQYAQAFGVRSLRYPSKPMQLDTTIWLASYTKLMTAVTLLQFVEDDLIRLEDGVTHILCELNDHDILIGFDDVSGEPITKKRTAVITVK
ncbi:hypothetical protein MMC14_009990 [Varicellaria rhodocarpa]|nr:hypothetical protein [Varicellaria rhodocarpa]